MKRVINLLRRILEILLSVLRKIGAARVNLSPEDSESEIKEAETLASFWNYPLHKSIPMPPREFGMWLIATLKNKHNNIRQKRNEKKGK